MAVAGGRAAARQAPSLPRFAGRVDVHGLGGRGYIACESEHFIPITQSGIEGRQKRIVVESSEIVSNNSSPAGNYTGIRVVYNSPGRPLRVVDSLVAGFYLGLDGSEPAFTDNLDGATIVANTTVVGTQNGIGVDIALQPGNHNYDDMNVILANNIIAGNNVGLQVVNSENDTGASIVIEGDKNAFFDNTNNVTTSGSAISISDNGRITPGYDLADAFVDPSNATMTSRDYRLLEAATALIDVGEQYQGTVLASGTQTWIDINNSGSTYQSGTDYIIDLGGFTGSTSGHKTALYDADYDETSDRHRFWAVDIGAYELQPGRGTVFRFR